VQTRADDQPIHLEVAPVGRHDETGVAGGRRPNERRAEPDLPAGRLHPPGQHLTHLPVVDDAGRLDPECFDRRDMRLDLTDLRRPDQPCRNPVRPGAVGEAVQRRTLVLLDGDDELATALDRDAVGPREREHRRRTGDAHPRLETSRRVVQTRVDDAGVAPGLVLRER